jgi:hypothetical protein
MNEEQTCAQVVLTGVDIPFGSLVKLIIKLSFASIPAIIIFSVIGWLIAFVITIIIASLGSGFW